MLISSFAFILHSTAGLVETMSGTGQPAPLVRVVCTQVSLVGGRQHGVINPHVGHNLCHPLAMTPQAQQQEVTHYLKRHAGQLLAHPPGCWQRSHICAAVLHTLVLLAYGAEQPHDPHGQGVRREVCHYYCHAWCAKASHIMWASHAVNQAMRPAVNGNVQVTHVRAATWRTAVLLGLLAVPPYGMHSYRQDGD
jgi:hypothetical protein